MTPWCVRQRAPLLAGADKLADNLVTAKAAGATGMLVLRADSPLESRAAPRIRMADRALPPSRAVRAGRSPSWTEQQGSDELLPEPERDEQDRRDPRDGAAGPRPQCQGDPQT